VLLAPFPSDDLGSPDVYEPRPAPERIDLFLAEAVRRLQYPADAVRNFRKFREETKEIGEEIAHRVKAMTYSARSGWFVNATDTPLNGKIGPNRRVAYLVTDLDDVKAVKNGLGGTVNDVVIAAIAGAVRSFLLEDRQFDVDGVDFRAMVPVSIRDESGIGELGNHITMWLVDLPIGEPDPVERYRMVGATTAHRKETDQALGAAMLTQGASFTPSTVLAVAARVAAATIRPFNLTVTNVPGPQIPLYLLESRLLRIFPMVPLWVNHGVGVALFSYDGLLNWGFASDWDTMPDLEAFVLRVEDSLAELLAAATD
jgi:diacylglycerol O-acyltransferase